MDLKTERFGSVSRMCQRMQEVNGYLVVAVTSDAKVLPGCTIRLTHDTVPNIDGSVVRVLAQATEREFASQALQFGMRRPYQAPAEIRFFKVIAE